MVANKFIARPSVLVKRSITADEIIVGLGGDLSTGKCLCPAHNDHNPSLSVTEDASGKVLVKCWAGCTQDALIGALKAQGLWGAQGNSNQAYTPTPRWKQNTPVKKDTTETAHNILREAARSTLKPTEYLRGRGITLMPDGVALITHVAALRLGLRRFPHMVVALVRDGQPVGTQVTALTMDARHKIECQRLEEKLTYGKARGGYVVLRAAAPERGRKQGGGGDCPLIIGEGVETVLSLMEILGLPDGIAALGVGNLPEINPPPAANYILGVDHDKNGGALRLARALAYKLKRSGSRVRYAIPTEPGTDWNDAIKKGDHSWLSDVG